MEEGSSSEAIFESLNLSPRLFINEILNVVDDLLDEAFEFFLQEASARLKTEGTDRAAELSKGVSYIRDLIQLTLDQRLQKWEEYCLRFCFSVPEGFLLPEAKDSHGDDLVDLDALTDTNLDAQLNSLRDRVSSVGKESAELERELRALEMQSLSSNLTSGSIDEALHLYKEHDSTHMFQELTTVASEFRSRLGNLKRKMAEETQHHRADKLKVNHDYVLGLPRSKGFFGAADLKELEEYLDEIKAP
ncbi:protein MIS12 homolog isoform X1 [Salvia splendens]|uniref:protein MIS12 homolog isoform X1 n=1 Tax=Salvia splendens TaxID=180675 RepID=UPI001101500D|nr:protein MIS12 homolog isoform X1 [Salvia splendens]